MPRNGDDDVKAIIDKIDASATLRIIVYIVVAIAAAAVVIYRVNLLESGQQDIRRELKLLTDPVDGLMIQFARMKADLDARVRDAEREHQSFREKDADYETRLRTIEMRRLSRGTGGAP